MSEIVDITCPNCKHTYPYRVQAPTVNLVGEPKKPDTQRPKSNSRKPSKLVETFSKFCAAILVIIIGIIMVSSALKDKGTEQADNYVKPVNERVVDNEPSVTKNDQSEIIDVAKIDQIYQVEQGKIYLINGVRWIDSDGDGNLDKIVSSGN